mgnify:CR=1 FL=1
MASQYYNPNRQPLKTDYYSGKWTPEEEVYFRALCEEFHAGTLDMPEGVSEKV